jgi:hypothetical protein
MPSPLLLPDDRKFVYPWIGLQIIADDFRATSEVNDMGRTEDISLGLDFQFRIGRATTGFGSSRNATILRLDTHKGWEPGGPGRMLLFDLSARARREPTGMEDSRVSANFTYYHRNLGRHLFSVNLAATAASRLDPEDQVLLGGDTGLRGYPLRYQSGERSAALSVEQRFFTDWYPARLIRVGYALFLDMGRFWGEDPRGTPNLGTLYDLGIGLRLTSPRSTGQSVVHIDLAFPVNAPADVDSLQISIEKKRSF